MFKDMFNVMQLRKVAIAAYEIGHPLLLYGEDYAILAGIDEPIQKSILSDLQKSGKKFRKEEVIAGHTSIIFASEYIGLDLNTEVLAEKFEEYLIIEHSICQMLNIYWKRDEVVFSRYLWKNKPIDQQSIVLTTLTKKILRLVRNTEYAVVIGPWGLSLSCIHVPFCILRRVFKYIRES